MDTRTDTFTQLRRRLHGIAYRMLGSGTEAEDVVQDAWPRSNASAPRRVQIEVVGINGEWGLLRSIDGVLESAQALDIADGCIARIHVQRNPHTLATIAALRAVAAGAAQP